MMLSLQTKALFNWHDIIQNAGTKKVWLVLWWKPPPPPAESPDLNPIEMVRAQLKRYLCKRVKPINQAELVRGIEQFWAEKMTPDLCSRYINHIHTVIPKVIAYKGGPTRE